MIDYELIFEKKQHYLTIPQEHNRKLCFGNPSIKKAIKNQKKNTDLFITKYSKEKIISCLIFDFDDENNPENAFKDAQRLQFLLKKQGLNTIIVKSGSKGYHTYIQVPIHCFNSEKYEYGVNSDEWFKKYCELILRAGVNAEYSTLDMNNTNAGFGGNIRVIGSVHPKTGNVCEIVSGEFLELVEPVYFDYDCFMNAFEFVKIHEKNQVLKRQKEASVNKFFNGDDPVKNNDLRELMPQIYGGDYKIFKNGYIMLQCPFHNDSHPSMIVKKEFYYCKSCGEKGNWWSLRDKGVVDFEKDELVRVGDCNLDNKDKMEV